MFTLILTLTHEHDPLYGHLFGVRGPGPSWPLLELGVHLLVKPGNVTALPTLGLHDRPQC